MKNKIKSLFLVVAVITGNSFAATLGTTTGADFTTATWTNSSSTSLGTWYQIQNPGSSFAIGDSTQGGRTSIGAQAFNLTPGSYTNTGNGYARTYFAFNGGDLSVGQTLKFDINFLWNGGTKGFSLEKAGGGAGAELFSFYQDWGDPLKLSEGGVPGTGVTSVLANGYQQAITLEATQEAGSIALNIKNNGSSIFSQTFTTANTIGQIQFFAGNIDPTQEVNSANQGIFFNNITIIPEPSTGLLMGLGLIGLAAVRRFRKNS